MRTFRVKVWGGETYQEVEANDPKAAVERLTGRKVREVGRRGTIVATVRQKPGNSEMPIPYYADEA